MKTGIPIVLALLMALVTATPPAEAGWDPGSAAGGMVLLIVAAAPGPCSGMDTPLWGKGLARDCEGRVKAAAQKKADAEQLLMHAAWRATLAATPESRESVRDIRWVDRPATTKFAASK